MLNAQTNNFWHEYRQGFSFNKAGKMVYYWGLTNDYRNINNSAIADFNGLPLLYTNGGYVHNAKSQLIANGDSLKHYFNTANSYYFLMLDTNHYLNYGMPKSNFTGIFNDSILYSSYIKRNLKAMPEFYVPQNNKNIPIQFTEKILCITACRNTEAQPVIVIRTKNYFYSYKILHGGIFKLLDTMYYPEDKIIPDSLSKNPLLSHYDEYYFQSLMQLSNNGEFIAFQDIFTFNTNFPNKEYYRNSNRSIISFDKQTGKFGTPKTINSNIRHRLINPTSLFTYTLDGFCFSPNDSFLYFHDVLINPNNTNNNQVDLYQYDLYSNNAPQSIYRKSNIKFANWVILNLNHLGEIFFFNRDEEINGKFYLSKIKQPNKPYPQCNVEMQSEVLPSQFQMYTQNNKHLYDYIRLNINFQYTCAATVNIKNNSQYYIGFTNYTWHIQNEQGIEQYYYTKEPPPLTYTKNGDYVIKLFGYSPRGKGYGEWYIDTIKVRIPPKPIANFYAKDSIVCRYTGLQFINHSHAQDTLKNEYLWSFGDGATSAAKNPMHTYTKPGVYTVTLHYKNGYCDSTLTKNQYIKVVDAPMPGFTVQYKQGCSPFIALFTDTTTLNVQQKDYYFSDTKLWQNVPVNQPTFTHTFAKAGVYKALQRLTGFSGCVIMQDSVIFNISKGLTIYDTTNVINSTVQAKNALVYWGAIDGAVSYQVYKNNSPYKTTADTFFQENIPYTQDVSYTIAGIDSCGNQCSQGRQGKPVFLQATMQGHNEAAVISFSPYLQWQGSNITYAIQKFINGTWQTINSQNANNGYTDNQFLNLGELQACYRIQSQEASQAQILSHSNELCLPYIPTIFIPTAFTPNDDAVNDSFDIVGYGLQSYNISIYNRWGELIFKGKPNEAWGGSNASDGVYTARIEYTTNKGIRLNQRVTVTLMK